MQAVTVSDADAAANRRRIRSMKKKIQQMKMRQRQLSRVEAGRYMLLAVAIMELGMGLLLSPVSLAMGAIALICFFFSKASPVASSVTTLIPYLLIVGAEMIVSEGALLVEPIWLAIRIPVLLCLVASIFAAIRYRELKAEHAASVGRAAV